MRHFIVQALQSYETQLRHLDSVQAYENELINFVKRYFADTYNSNYQLQDTEIINTIRGCYGEPECECGSCIYHINLAKRRQVIMDTINDLLNM